MPCFFGTALRLRLPLLLPSVSRWPPLCCMLRRRLGAVWQLPDYDIVLFVTRLCFGLALSCLSMLSLRPMLSSVEAIGTIHGTAEYTYESPFSPLPLLRHQCFQDPPGWRLAAFYRERSPDCEIYCVCAMYVISHLPALTIPNRTHYVPGPSFQPPTVCMMYWAPYLQPPTVRMMYWAAYLQPPTV